MSKPWQWGEESFNSGVEAMSGIAAHLAGEIENRDLGLIYHEGAHGARAYRIAITVRLVRAESGTEKPLARRG